MPVRDDLIGETWWDRVGTKKQRHKGRCIWGSVITRGGLVMVDHRLSSIARPSDWIGCVADRFRETAMAKRLRYTKHQTYLCELSRKKRLFLCPAITGATLPLFPRSSPQRRIFAHSYRCTYQVIIAEYRYVRLCNCKYNCNSPNPKRSSSTFCSPLRANNK